MKNSNKVQKKFQNSKEDRISHFNISVTIKRQKDDNKQRTVCKNRYKFPYKHGKDFEYITKFYNDNDVNVIASE